MASSGRPRWYKTVTSCLIAPGHLVQHRTKGQLHVRQDLRRIALAHQQRSHRTGHLRGKTVPIHHPHALRQRVYTETLERQVHERDPGQNSGLYPGIGPQQLHRPFGYCR